MEWDTGAVLRQGYGTTRSNPKSSSAFHSTKKMGQIKLNFTIVLKEFFHFSSACSVFPPFFSFSCFLQRFEFFNKQYFKRHSIFCRFYFSSVMFPKSSVKIASRTYVSFAVFYALKNIYGRIHIIFVSGPPTLWVRRASLFFLPVKKRAGYGSRTRLLCLESRH